MTGRARWDATFECRTCGEILTGTVAAALRHADAHGGARLEGVIRLELERS